MPGLLNAGPRNDNSKRANLTFTFAKLVVEMRPEWVVMENVYNITRSRILSKILKMLASYGYGII